MKAGRKVGVTTSVRGSTLMWVFYWLALRLAGLRPVRLTSANAQTHDLATFNGFVIGGGDNIGAEIYKGDLTLDVKIDPDRDQLELSVLQVAEERGLPVSFPYYFTPKNGEAVRKILEKAGGRRPREKTLRQLNDESGGDRDYWQRKMEEQTGVRDE